MGAKRNHDTLSYSDTETPNSSPMIKKQRNRASQDSHRQKQQQQQQQQQLPGTDLTYGQRCVFGGLDGATAPGDDDLECEDETDALAYLKSVRNEASAIPHVLVAPKTGPHGPPAPADNQTDTSGHAIYTNGVGDSRGYYHDGAYTAAPDTASAADDDNDHQEDTELEPCAQQHRVREAYFTVLISRFNHLRSLLKRQPPSSVLATLPHNNTPDLTVPSAAWYRAWTYRLQHTDPYPAQVASMDSRETALRIVRTVLLTGKFLRRGIELHERTSRWIWALLARLPDRGEMDYVEVGWVRELGKRAVLMMVGLREMEMLRNEADLEEEPEDTEEGTTERQEAEKKKKKKEDKQGEVEQKEEEAEEGEVLDLDEALSSVATGLDEQSENLPTARSLNGGNETEVSLKRQSNNQEGGLDNDIDLEAGDNLDKSITSVSAETNLQSAKARLLAHLDGVPDGHKEESCTVQSGIDEEGNSDELRSRVNMRATLNFILTIAGEIYGQRDLLEFRDPFSRLGE